MPPRGEFWWAASPARSTLPTAHASPPPGGTPDVQRAREHGSPSHGAAAAPSRPIPSVPPAASSSPSSLRRQGGRRQLGVGVVGADREQHPPVVRRAQQDQPLVGIGHVVDQVQVRRAGPPARRRPTPPGIARDRSRPAARCRARCGPASARRRPPPPTGRGTRRTRPQSPPAGARRRSSWATTPWARQPKRTSTGRPPWSATGPARASAVNLSCSSWIRNGKAVTSARTPRSNVATGPARRSRNWVVGARRPEATTGPARSSSSNSSSVGGWKVDARDSTLTAPRPSPAPAPARRPGPGSGRPPGPWDPRRSTTTASVRSTPPSDASRPSPAGSTRLSGSGSPSRSVVTEQAPEPVDAVVDAVARAEPYHSVAALMAMTGLPSRSSRSAAWRTKPGWCPPARWPRRRRRRARPRPSSRLGPG